MQFLKKVDKSQTLLINEQSKKLEKEGKQIIKFGFGESPFPPIKAAVEALKNNASEKFYSPVQGILELREKIANFHSKIDGLNITADRVLVGAGSKILIYAVLASFKKANVFIPAPAWVSYSPQAKLCGHKAIYLQTNFEKRWRIDSKTILEAVGKVKNNYPNILILNYPGNPDGLTYSAHELQELALVLKKHNFIVISDEIYGLLNHKGNHTSLAKFYENTIITTGLSKWCGAGGWRLGALILPEALNGEFKQVLLGIASETYSCATTPVQLAGIKAYELSSEFKSYIEKQRLILQRIGGYIADELQESGIKVHQPEGGFYLFPDFSNFTKGLKKLRINNSSELCAEILKKTGVAILNGSSFNMDEKSLTARLAYVDFDGAKLLTLSDAEILAKNFIDLNTPKIKLGVDGLKAFVGGL
jgi:aspartate aminotransferase